MTLAATRQYALALSAVVGVVATVVAALLIAVIFESPERVALATSDSDLSSIVYLVLERLQSVVVAVWRILL
jgi:hypothetical protein